MRNVEVAQFVITLDRQARVGTCLVSGIVHFDRFDRALLREGLTYRLTCVLWGADQYLIENPGTYPDPDLVRAPRHDDRLLEIGRMSITGEQESYRFRFRKDVSFQVLNEDRGTRERQPDGSLFMVNPIDELYVTVTLDSAITRPLAGLSAQVRQNFG
jgi:hypothetical protein